MYKPLKFTLASLLIFLSACQVYRNNGRNMFESASPGKVSTNLGIQSEKKDCWQQLRNEPLWTPTDNSNLHVEIIDEKNLEVCLEIIH